ncbi:MAG: hypothetical protein HUN04_07550 [Desulfobacter sp.]|nr:MAG: hypothetical protein HUN04_07550 [Desulfobacter sp.]
MKIETDFYTFEPFHNLLYVKSYKSWDERVVENFINHGQQVALEAYNKKNWAILHDGREWELGTPAIESMMIKMLNNPVTKTLTHHAYVTGPSEMKQWQVKKVFDNITRHEAKIFQNLADAEKWLSSFGYTKTQN